MSGPLQTDRNLTAWLPTEASEAAFDQPGDHAADQDQRRDAKHPERRAHHGELARVRAAQRLEVVDVNQGVHAERDPDAEVDDLVDLVGQAQVHVDRIEQAIPAGLFGAGDPADHASSRNADL